MKAQIPGLPLYSLGAISAIDCYLDRNMRAFEWGLGGSTLFIARRVSTLVSVEHNQFWYDIVQAKIKHWSVANCELVLHPPELGFDKRYLSSSYENMNFRRYVKEIDRFPDSYFDFIAIDGRARIGCMLHAMSKLKSKGLLLLDNSDRERYADTQHLLHLWNRETFIGPLPHHPSNVLVATSIWTKI